MLSLASSIPLWLKLKTEKQPKLQKDTTLKKTIHHQLPQNLDVALRYGALTDLNQFYYSPKQHSWTNTKDSADDQASVWLSLDLDQRT